MSIDINIYYTTTLLKHLKEHNSIRIEFKREAFSLLVFQKNMSNYKSNIKIILVYKISRSTLFQGIIH